MKSGPMRFRRLGLIGAAIAAALIVALGGLSLLASYSEGQPAAPLGEVGTTLRPAHAGAISQHPTTVPTPSVMCSCIPIEPLPLAPTPTLPRRSAPPVVATPAPAAARFSANGMTWQAPQSPGFAEVMKVPNGFVGTVQYAGNVTGYGSDVYTSPDGIGWTSPPDPSIFVNQGEETFLVGWFPPAKGPAGYLMAGSGTFGAPSTIWQSLDGVRWQAMKIDAFAGRDVWSLWPTRTGYLATDNRDQYWTSADGIKWEEAGFDGFRLQSGDPGKPMFAGGEGGWSWFSLDGGKSWNQIGYPAGAKLFYGVAKLGNRYYGSWSVNGALVLYSTKDLRTWSRVPNAPMRSAASMTVAGGRLYAIEWPEKLGEPSEHGVVWTSPDGSTWQRMLDNAGRPMVGDDLSVLAGRLFVVTDGFRIQWVASPA